MAMTFSPFWCVYPEYPIPSPLFGPRCWSRRHGVYAHRASSRPRDAPHWHERLLERPIIGPFGKRSIDIGVVNFRLARGTFRNGQALPLHPRIQHPQNEVKEAMIADFAPRTAL